MRYIQFSIEHYRAIRHKLTIDIDNHTLFPFIGINECGKTTILQALFCFDYSNDSYYRGMHLRNTTNLYNVNDNQEAAKISAVLKVDPDEMKTCYRQYINDYRQYIHELPRASRNSNISDKEPAADSEDAPAPDAIDEGQERAMIEDKLARMMEGWGKDSQLLEITRQIDDPEMGSPDNLYISLRVMSNKDTENEVLTKHLTSSISINIKDRSDVDAFVRVLLFYGPHILYSDDFYERPPSEVAIPTNEQTKLNEWQDIYDTLFKLSLENRPSLFQIANEKNENRRLSQLKQIQLGLNQQLKEAWKTFLSPDEELFNIELSVLNATKKKRLIIKVCEEQLDTQSAPRTFDITNRSKGFIWYFNLIMKIRYNPKAYRERSNSNTIFLLDEPGSYLHASAQEALCKKIKEISNSSGVVLYCTHSYHLLNPESIPSQRVQIVVKDEINNIMITQPHLKKGQTSPPAAEIPLYEALHIPFLNARGPVILVEGIYDAYALRLLVLPELQDKISEKIYVVPGTNAYSIVQLLSYFIGFRFKYVALWDNDEEGKQEQERAKQVFGDLESHNFLLLPLMSNQTRMRMEDMIAPNDIKRLATELKLDSAKYEKVLLALFAEKEKTQQHLRDLLSNASKENFAALTDLIAQQLQT